METHIVYCPTCNVQVMAVNKAQFTQSSPAPYGELSSTNTTWALAECPRCLQVFLETSEYVDVEGVAHPTDPPTVVYPPRDSIQNASNFRLPKSLCVIVADALRSDTPAPSHTTLELLFITSGAPTPSKQILDLSHPQKWKMWLYQVGSDPTVDSLRFLGALLEEFMDIRRNDSTYAAHRESVMNALHDHGLAYYQGGQILPIGTTVEQPRPTLSTPTLHTPSEVEDVLQRLVAGLPRAMYPLEIRRKDSPSLNFNTEYDIQDLLHAMMRPWIADIRAEEYTPSYAGTSKRMDFLLPRYRQVLELKYVRNRKHARKIGDELTIDIAHYGAHAGCDRLWCIVYDPNGHIENPASLRDLEGECKNANGTVTVRVSTIQGRS